MARLRDSGWTLAEIASLYGVSGERIRQVLRVKGRTADPTEIAEARRGRAEREAEARVDALLWRWRAGDSPCHIASALGLRTAACTSVIARHATDVDRAARRASTAATRTAQRYSNRDIVVALQAVAARLGHVPSCREYGALARQLDLPRRPTVLNRMGDWASAVRAAEMGLVGSRGGGPRWTQDACWAALRGVVEDLGSAPTVVSYERFARGRVDLPSAATIRKRLGRWSQILARLAAERELASLHEQRSPEMASRATTVADGGWSVPP